MKYYVYRFHNQFEFKRTKCNDCWTPNYSICWQYTKQGAKNIADRENIKGKGFYEYGVVAVDEVEDLIRSKT